MSFFANFNIDSNVFEEQKPVPFTPSKTGGSGVVVENIGVYPALEINPQTTADISTKVDLSNMKLAESSFMESIFGKGFSFPEANNNNIDNKQNVKQPEVFPIPSVESIAKASTTGGALFSVLGSIFGKISDEISGIFKNTEENDVPNDHIIDLTTTTGIPVTKDAPIVSGEEPIAMAGSGIVILFGLVAFLYFKG